MLGCEWSDREVVSSAVPVELELGADVARVERPYIFADGARIDEVRVVPAKPAWGATAAVSWQSQGGSDHPGAVARVSLVPPVPHLREEVAYGPAAAPPPTRDPRVTTVDVPWSRGHADLVLPPGVHARSLVALLQRRVDDEPVELTQGAKTQGGEAIIGVLPVATRPTQVEAWAVERGAITVDGRLNESIWRRPGYELVESLDGDPVSGPTTRVWFSWSDHGLYMAADVPDTDIWTSFREQDDPLWKEEAIELFVAGSASGRDYVEFQVNARGVTFDARFPVHRRGEENWDADLQAAVQVQGTLDNRRDRDRGWTVEMVVAWSTLCAETSFECPPVAGRTLRINTFRLERPEGGGASAFALSPTRVPDFHAWDNSAILELAP